MLVVVTCIPFKTSISQASGIVALFLTKSAESWPPKPINETSQNNPPQKPNTRNLEGAAETATMKRRLPFRLLFSPDKVMPDESVTTWIQKVQSKDPVAAQLLWNRYAHGLISLARVRLGRIRTVADEEDVVAVAFEKFLRTASEGRLPNLSDRHDLWRVLVLLTEQAAVDEVRRQRAQKRGGGSVQGESALANNEYGSAHAGMNDVPGREPTPEFALSAAERCRELLDALKSDELQRIAVAKLDGHSINAIAQRFDLSPRSVERKLNLIRKIWLSEKSE